MWSNKLHLAHLSSMFLFWSDEELVMFSRLEHLFADA
jgi:hypothetical protein